jgi:tetratricopeptide (TPR) repeat protein
VRSALSEVREGLEANPTEPDAWLAGLRIAALASLGGGPVAEPRALAAQYLEGALRSDPLSGHLRRRIARILLSTGDQAGAVEQYRLAMRDASVDREETVRQMLEQGIAPEEIVGAVPARFEDVYAAGVALVVAGHPEAAEGTFLAAAKLDPSSHLPWLSLSRLKEVEGRHRESLEDATAALGRFPSLDAGARAELLFAAAIASAALGEPREALARAREALNITPRVAPLRDLAGRMLFATGDARGAIDEWSYILENLPGDPWLSENREGLHKRLGTAFEALGLRAKALDHWLEALRLAPKDPEARLAIERLSGNG